MLSHRAIVAEAASKKWKNVLVFEDDVIIVDPKKFIEQIADLLKVKKYDIAYF
jgi:GR25 family glycosyltransferase involved in LPS biosynthesis